jgi:multicomponent Na+:H+ antiporter subunit E
MIRRLVALWLWAAAVWLLLTWTATAEQLVFGGLLAAFVAVLMAPVGDVAAPWHFLDPRRLAAIVVLFGYAVVRIVQANIGLARRIWSPSRPLASGMLIVPTRARTDAQLASTGLITSLIVDNQIVDVDRNRHLLQYHAVAVPPGDKAEQADEINTPIERLLARIDRGDR